MNFWKNLLKIFSEELPLWAYGLNCEICKMCFYSPEGHHMQVSKNKNLLKKHSGKTPSLLK